MQYPSYSFGQSDDATQFFFESVGPKGVIQKAILFTPTEQGELYNLALVNQDPVSGVYDDTVVSNNADTAKILATLVRTIQLFLSRYPNCRVAFAGNTAARNRLYRMAISRAYPELSAIFVLFGYRNDGWESFENGHDYELFLIARK
ncbi:MAG: hypothetical protein H7Z72_18565 [Bacteroidetes bacterium]|nr:hypothetical protein [Fibrella sp.]